MSWRCNDRTTNEEVLKETKLTEDAECIVNRIELLELILLLEGPETFYAGPYVFSLVLLHSTEY